MFGVLNHHIPKGQIDKVRGALPEDVRDMWPDGDGQAQNEQRKRKATGGM